MDMSEVALKLTLAVIENGQVAFGPADEPQTVGTNLAELYDAVLSKLVD